MSCQPAPATFRLLDAYVGWDPLDVCKLAGEQDLAGLRLAPVDQPVGLRRRDLLAWFPPGRLTPGCGTGAWYLAAPAAGLLRRDPCIGWRPVWPPHCRPELVDRPRLITARGHGLAVARGHRVALWRRDGTQLVALIDVRRASALALTSRGELLVARRRSVDLLRFDPTGAFRGRLRTGLDLGRRGRIAGLRTGRDHTLWLLSIDPRAGWRLWRGSPEAAGFVEATVAELAAAVPASTLAGVSPRGFCLDEPGPDGEHVRCCYDWEGGLLDPARLGGPVAPPLQTAGQLLTRTIDSGIDRCRWHRVRLDADVPPGTAVQVAVATSDDPTPAGAVPVPGDWQGCPAGLADPADWQLAPPGATDLLLTQPPGRYLYMRIRLTGDGVATPVLRRVQLDFPRATSAELLPPVFRQDPAADDFTERFLALFDASLGELDRAVERYPALLDPHGVPDEVLPWLAGLIGVVFEPDWDARVRRALLAAAPELHRRRGTPWALREVVRLVFGTTPVLTELAGQRAWVALSRDSRLRSARLFGRSAARFRVGTSALSRTPLRSFGDPDQDPVTAQAHRIGVLVGPAAGGAPVDVAAVARLLAQQAPAHTVLDVRAGGPAFVVGHWSTVGVDTALAPLPAPVLGPVPEATGPGRPVRLGRHSVLWPAHGRRVGLQVGLRSAVGIHTEAR